jgi:hypothetical protein
VVEKTLADMVIAAAVGRSRRARGFRPIWSGNLDGRDGWSVVP